MQQITFIAVLAGWFLLGAMAQQVPNARYFIPNFIANWHRATEHCFFLGMRLAITDSVEHHSQVVEEIRRSPVFNNESTVVWLAASDLGQEGIFYWHSTGVRVGFLNWRSDNPDNFGGIEDCVALVNIPGRDWNWHANDAGCDAAHYFICENEEDTGDVQPF